MIFKSFDFSLKILKSPQRKEELLLEVEELKNQVRKKEEMISQLGQSL